VFGVIIKMNSMRRIFTAILALLGFAILTQIYNLYSQGSKLQQNLSLITAKVEAFKKENSDLQADLQYFSIPENLVKELRSRFNYKKPGEKLIIVVPPKEATTSQ